MLLVFIFYFFNIFYFIFNNWHLIIATNLATLLEDFTCRKGTAAAILGIGSGFDLQPAGNCPHAATCVHARISKQDCETALPDMHK